MIIIIILTTQMILIVITNVASGFRAIANRSDSESRRSKIVWFTSLLPETSPFHVMVATAFNDHLSHTFLRMRTRICIAQELKRSGRGVSR